MQSRPAEPPMSETSSTAQLMQKKKDLRTHRLPWKSRAKTATEPHDPRFVQAMATRAGEIAAHSVRHAQGRQKFWQNLKQIKEANKELKVERAVVLSTLVKNQRAEESFKTFLVDWVRSDDPDLSSEGIIAKYLPTEPREQLPTEFWKTYIAFLTYRVKPTPSFELVARVSLTHSVYSAMAAYQRMTKSTLCGDTRKLCLDLSKTIKLTQAPLTRAKPIATYKDVMHIVKNGMYA